MMAGYIPPYKTPPEVTRNLMQMLDALHRGLSRDPVDPDMAANCSSAKWRKAFCEKYKVPVTPESEGGGPRAAPKQIGDDFVYYDTNGTGVDGASERILSALEEALGSTSLTPPGPPPGQSQSEQGMPYSALSAFFYKLLGAPSDVTQFNSGTEAQRVNLLNTYGMNTNVFNERTALEDYQPTGQNTELRTSMKNMGATLYEKYQFFC
ncbi:hypothetical protein [Cystobacter fuscus]|uniref:hypothetical protein n=1 Tax=Cystobacter fuscus TaxID=43 RepID=UPI002B27EA11|nr:hypothetical protein F0U63_37800 [Cystobacter fuscus]